MIKEARIKLQQKIIEDLKAENNILKEELKLVKFELESEKNLKDQECSAVEDLIIELNKQKAIYDDLIRDVMLAKSQYEEKEKEMNELKARYNKEMKQLIKDIKKNI